MEKDDSSPYLPVQPTSNRNLSFMITLTITVCRGPTMEQNQGIFHLPKTRKRQVSNESDFTLFWFDPLHSLSFFLSFWEMKLSDLLKHHNSPFTQYFFTTQLCFTTLSVLSLSRYTLNLMMIFLFMFLFLPCGLDVFKCQSSK